MSDPVKVMFVTHTSFHSVENITLTVLNSFQFRLPVLKTFSIKKVYYNHVKNLLKTVLISFYAGEI